MEQGQPIKRNRGIAFPIVAGFALACGCLGLIILGLGRFQVEIILDSDEPETPAIAPEVAETPLTLSPSLENAAVPTPQTGRQEVAPSTPLAPALATAPVRIPRSLRVSNQTRHPIRVALLAQTPSPNSSQNLETLGNVKNSPTPYRQPAHWDFAPEEGSQQGLTLSLPEGDLQLSSGDILVAFAQDGSRRYWGPYVVGKTPTPLWQEQTEEWHLILKP